MKLVIEISSYDKEWITNGYYIPEEINMRISEAIANGTPLPKGYGDLIDRDLLRNKISEDKRGAFTKHEVWLLASKYNTDVHVVVPADKE